MKSVITAAAVLTAATSTAVAGGLERSAPSSAILFEEGTYAEFSFSSINPSISGVFTHPIAGPLPSGDMANTYQTWSFGYKRDLTDELALALVVDQPFGVNVTYPTSAAPYPFAGSSAELSTQSVNALLRYRFPGDVSVFGGLRMQGMKGDILLVSPAGTYPLSVPYSWEAGYALGVAYERPDIALRVALSYYSDITHTFTDNLSNPFDVVTPESFNLEFQTGIAADTLLFGSIRWVDWAVTDITPPDLGSTLVDYSSATTSYSLGVGRRFNETWSGAIVLGHEPAVGGLTSNLGPKNGYNSIGLAASWTRDNIKITGGVRYFDLGDATTTTIGAEFSDNHAVAAGVKLAVNF